MTLTVCGSKATAVKFLGGFVNTVNRISGIISELTVQQALNEASLFLTHSFSCKVSEHILPTTMNCLKYCEEETRFIHVMIALNRP